MYKGAVLDLDNTLFPTSAYESKIVASTVSAMKVHGFPPTQEEGEQALRELRTQNPNAPDHYDRLCDAFGVKGSEKFKLVKMGVDVYHSVKDKEFVPQEETTGFLNTLVENNFRIAVVTKGVEKNQIEKLKRLNILGYIRDEDNNLTFAYVSEEENDRETLVRKAIKDLKLDPQQSFVVDDRPYGIVAAKKVGIICGFRMMQGKYAGESYPEETPAELMHDEEVTSLPQVIAELEERGLMQVQIRAQ